FAAGISGSNIAGYYMDAGGDYHGFSYNGFNYTPLDDPSASDATTDPAGYNGTLATGVSGSWTVGYYVDDNGLDHGFALSGTAYTTLDAPLGSEGTYAMGVSGTIVVGYYVDA